MIKKFDICLMNPPYAKNLHLKFLEKTIQIADTVVSVQPVRWLQDPLSLEKKITDYKRYEETISKHIKKLDIINGNDATKLFSANFIGDIGIYMCNSNMSYDNYSNIKYIRDGIDYSFIKKIIERVHKENNFKKLNIQKWNEKIENFIPLNSVSGETVSRCKPTNAIKEWSNAYKNALDYKYDKSHKSGVARGKIENDLCVVFNTYEEAENCFKTFTTTNFTRFYMSFITTDIHVIQDCMPWMNSYKTVWTDEMFYKYFNLTKQNIKLIEDYAENVWKRL